VNLASRHPSARQYISDLAARGRYDFSPREVQSELGVSADAVKLALNRLSKQKLIASPSRGFWVIVPPEYRSLGCPPADQFIPALMTRLKLPYYVGLLSAAQYYGAAHQRPQALSVVLAKNRPPIHCGMVRVDFVARKRVAEVPRESFNTPRGALQVSSPEATALDLVGYAEHAGGLNQVATVLSELAEKIDAEKLAAAAETTPVPWAQRLGYLLDHLGLSAKTGALKAYVRKHARVSADLLPKAPRGRARRNKDWRLYVNGKVIEHLPGVHGKRDRLRQSGFLAGAASSKRTWFAGARACGKSPAAG